METIIVLVATMQLRPVRPMSTPVTILLDKETAKRVDNSKQNDGQVCPCANHEGTWGSGGTAL